MVQCEQPSLPELIDIPTLAELLGVNERFMRRRVLNREIPYVKIGRFVRFDVGEIGRWIDEQRRPPELAE